MDEEEAQGAERALTKCDLIQKKKSLVGKATNNDAIKLKCVTDETCACNNPLTLKAAIAAAMDERPAYIRVGL